MPPACVVLEDAEAGIRAAAAAGMAAVMVPDLAQPSAACRELCTAVVESLAAAVPVLRRWPAERPMSPPMRSRAAGAEARRRLR